MLSSLALLSSLLASHSCTKEYMAASFYFHSIIHSFKIYSLQKSKKANLSTDLLLTNPLNSGTKIQIWRKSSK